MRRILIIWVLVVLVFGRAEAFTLRNAPAIEPHLGTRPSILGAEAFSEDLLTKDSKSTTKAVLYSLLLPGLGQQYLDEAHQSRIFYTVEAAIWTSFAVFQVQGNLREEEYKAYAQSFARVSSTGHSDDYYRILTEYDSSQEYEYDIKSEGRAILYPDLDTATLERYFVDHRVGDYEPWVWQSAENRRAYQDRRSASKRAYRRGVYAVAAAVANRAASAFFAFRSARRADMADGSQAGFYLEFGAPAGPVSNDAQTGLSFVRDF